MSFPNKRRAPRVRSGVDPALAGQFVVRALQPAVEKDNASALTISRDGDAFVVETPSVLPAGWTWRRAAYAGSGEKARVICRSLDGDSGEVIDPNASIAGVKPAGGDCDACPLEKRCALTAVVHGLVSNAGDVLGRGAVLVSEGAWHAGIQEIVADDLDAHDGLPSQSYPLSAVTLRKAGNDYRALAFGEPAGASIAAVLALKAAFPELLGDGGENHA